MAIISVPTSIGGVALPGSAGKLASGPLAALFGGKGVDTFSYPSDLAKDATKSHYVQFFIKEVIPAGYQSTNGTNKGASIQLNGVNSLVGAALGTSTGQAVTGAVGGAASSVVSNLFSNSTVASVANGLGISQSDVTSLPSAIAQTLSEGLQIAPSTTNAKAYISLYMPDTLEANYSAQFEPISVTDALGSTLNTIRGIDQLAKKGFDAMGGEISLQSLKKAYTSLSGDPNVAKLITDLETGGLGYLGANSGQMNELLLNAKGITVNPQMQMVYRGLDFRSFSLSFTFTPNSKAEAQVVDNIIYTFKYFGSPALQAGAVSSIQSMYLTPPAIFNVKFFIKGIENQYLPKYADCVLTDISVNYAPNGFAAHVDGAPVQTTLNLQFKEIEIVEKGRLAQGKSSSGQGLR